MMRTVLNAASSVVGNALLGPRGVKPIFPLYHITPFCNLRCSYCDGFPELGLTRETGWEIRERDRSRYELDTHGVRELLRILRKRFDALFLSGGEPLVRDDIEEVCEYACEIGFRVISLNTNGLLLDEKESVLRSISHLVFSLDALDEQDSPRTAGAADGVFARILENFGRCLGLRERYGFRLVVHSVIQPGRLAVAEEVLRSCVSRGIDVCLSPLHHKYRVDWLDGSRQAYAGLLDEIMRLKRQGASISGSHAFYENMKTMETFTCAPFAIPRIIPDGRILYPCRPRGRIGASILDAGSWERALAETAAKYGPPRPCTDSCRIRCYVEPSLLIRKPWLVLKEIR
ncbi:MAG: radical SAM protein [Candidatus Eisenbacteria bacterium]